MTSLREGNYRQTEKLHRRTM